MANGLLWSIAKLLYRLKCESKVKTTKKLKVGAYSLICKISRVKGRVGAPRWGLGWMTNESIYSHGPTQTKQQVG
jgi:hypothetical protein